MTRSMPWRLLRWVWEIGLISALLTVVDVTHLVAWRIVALSLLIAVIRLDARLYGD